MRVPDAARAVVAPEKVIRSLLVPEHPQNRGKAAFFSRFGFPREQWAVFAAALAEHARTHPVERVIPEPGRTTYTVVGALRTSNGWVTVEFFRNGQTVAVTDVPLDRLQVIRSAPATLTAQEPA